MRRLVCAVVLAALGGVTAPAYAERVDVVTADDAPLAGRVVVLDPGHQLGNRHFPRQVNRLVPDGRGGRKACNTTGTATAGGFAESTFVWLVAGLLRDRLEEQGATVRMTRTSNRDDRWGPCVDVRGRAGNRPRADLKLSLHADGNLTQGARGFHVITAPDAARGSARLARDVRRELRRGGFGVATYIAGGDGLDVRTDLATLNFARIPTAMVELGNMRNAADAGQMTSSRGRREYAAGLASAIERYLS